MAIKAEKLTICKSFVPVDEWMVLGLSLISIIIGS